jgi:urease accessory protein
LGDREFTAPLKLAKPFYHENFTELMLMCASAGMLDGDHYDLAFDLAADTAARVSAQAYTKIFPARDSGARQTLTLRLAEDAALIYLPPPVIPFAGSRFRGQTEIHLTAGSRLFFGEIVAAGRVGMGERFHFEQYRSCTTVYVDGEPVFLDHTRLIPAEADLNGLGFFEGHSHIGTFYSYGGKKPELGPEKSDNSPAPPLEAALSQAAAGYCIRMLGDSGAELLDLAQQLASASLGFGR